MAQQGQRREGLADSLNQIWNGHGTNFSMTLSAAGIWVPSTAPVLALWMVPAEFQYNAQGEAFSIGTLAPYISKFTPDTNTAHGDIIKLQKVDAGGGILDTLNQFTFPGGSGLTQPAAFDMRSLSTFNKGYILKRGEGLRLDLVSSSTGLTTGIAITKANPGVVTTAAAHGYSDGDLLTFDGLNGTAGWDAGWTTLLEGATWKLKYVSTTTFQIVNPTTNVAVDTSAQAAAITANAANTVTNISQRNQDIRFYISGEAYGVAA